MLGAKVKAMLDGRAHASVDDIKEVLLPAMRHRVLLNFEGETEGYTADDVLADIKSNLATQVEMVAN